MLTLLIGILLIGLLWNLVILAVMWWLGIPTSVLLQKLVWVPWGITGLSISLIIFWAVQAVVAAVSGSTLEVFDREKAARRVARTFGYTVVAARPRSSHEQLLTEMAKLPDHVAGREDWRWRD